MDGLLGNSVVVTFLTIFGVVYLVGLCIFCVYWGGACESCGSWKTHNVFSTSVDNHRPGGYYETTSVVCLKCGHHTVGVSEFVENPRSVYDDNTGSKL